MEVDVDDVLTIDGNEVQLANTIGDVVEFSDFVVVRLELTGESFPGIKQNVLRVDPDGTIRWRIEKAPEDGQYDAYGGIHEDEGTLYAYNLTGISYEVDLETGAVSDGTVVK